MPTAEPRLSTRTISAAARLRWPVKAQTLGAGKMPALLLEDRLAFPAREAWPSWGAPASRRLSGRRS